LSEAKKASRRTWAIAVIALIIIAGAGYYYYSTPAAPPAPTGPEFIKVGTVLPMTGQFSREGLFFKTGYELATKELNDQGGIFIKEFNRKIPVKLIVLDDESDKAKTVRLVEELATKERVDFYLGGYSTPLVLAQVEVPAKYGIPYVNGGGASTEIHVNKDGSRRSPWVWGVLVPIPVIGSETMELLKVEIDKGNLPKPTKVAMVWQNTAHGRDYRAGVQTVMKKYPGYFELVLNEPFEAKATDYTSLLLKVKGVKAEAFLCDCHFPHYLQMHRQYIELGMYGQHKFISYGARGPETKARQEFKDKSDFLVAILWWTEQLPYKQVKDFVQKWQSYSDLPVKGEWYPTLAYETARTLYKGIEKAGSLDKANVRDAIQNIQIGEALLPGQTVAFDQNGIITASMVGVQNLPGGGVAIVWPPDAATAKTGFIK